MFMDFFKYFYAMPRPYLLTGNIKPIACLLSFGNPSSHSMASSIAPIVIILDIFHGSPISFDSVKDNKIFYSSTTYFLSLLLALYWQISMPYIRYLGGAHSLNQIIFGSTIGIFVGLICHFVIRDHLIIFIERIYLE